MEEIWKDIEGFEGIYQVSNLGRVKRLATGSGWYKHDKMVTQGLDNGIPRVQLLLGGQYQGGHRSYWVARLVLKAFVGTNKARVVFMDGNPMNCRLDNLAYREVPVKLPRSYKVSDNDVRQIVSLRKTGWSLSQVAAMFNLDPSYVSLIDSGKRRQKALQE